MSINQCRGCYSRNLEILIDLGNSPVSNAFLSSREEIVSEETFPLCVYVCMDCGFTQLPNSSEREVHFNENYAYFSSFSSSWLKHSKNYVDEMLERDLLDENDLVVEIASNDGYLLQYFKDAGVKVLGVEPSRNVAESAISKGIPTEIEFMGVSTAYNLIRKSGKAKLILGNNVLAHVPDIHDFIQGIEILLAEDGLITFEFPHLYELLKHSQFDTIYHEHYSYLSISALKPIFEKYDLKITDVKSLPTHGGSLRIEIRRRASLSEVSLSVQECLDLEASLDVRREAVRVEFRNSVNRIVVNLRSEIGKIVTSGKSIAGFGAAAKGNTLLNFASISEIEIKYIVDSNPFKQDTLAPGSHIPIVGIEHMKDYPTDVFIVLPWNLIDEIAGLIKKELGEQTLVLRAIPKLEYV